MKTKRLFAIALVLSFSASCLASLAAVRYMSNEQYHAVYSIDEKTGTGNGLAYVSNIHFMNCMASDNNANIYSIGTGPGPEFDSHIVLINPKSGQIIPDVSLDFNGIDASETIKALAWNAQKGLLGVDINDKLVQIDLVSGQGIVIGRIGSIALPINISGLAFSPDGRLFGWGVDRYGLIEINPDTAEFTDVNPAVDGGNNIQTLEFAPDGSVLYGARDSLYTIDTVTGQATAIGTGQGFNDIRGIAFQVDSSLGPKIVYPNGGEMLIAGKEVQIKLNLNGITEMMSLEISTDNGLAWTQLAQIRNQSTFNWKAEGISSSCLLKISQVSNPAKSDISDKTFTIYECVIPKPADINNDCLINLEDLAEMAKNWLMKSPVRIKREMLDADPGWSTEDLWQFGTPMAMGGQSNGNPDPDSGSTGPSVYGVNLEGDYVIDLSGPHYLTSGPFNCSGISDLSVGFARWLNTDGPEYVKATIDFSIDNVNWENIWTNTVAIEDAQWQFVEYPLGAEADNAKQVYIRWGYEVVHDRAYLYSGWNIDDIELAGQK